ncbi:MAG: hypothetical protein L6U99_13295 [Clostridium sp.]|nr:MAG: hypothetical protein L6U99_13295 [Clostridium sp.]
MKKKLKKKNPIEEMLLEDAIKIKPSYKVGDIVEQPINIKNFFQEQELVLLRVLGHKI